MDETKLLNGKVALVTGASRGIGAEIAKVFASNGCQLAVVYLNSRKQAQAVKTACLSNGSNAEIFQCDISNLKSIKQTVRSVVRLFKKIDILVNCAGVIKQTDFEKITEDEYDFILNINLKGAFFFSQAIIPYLTKTKGKIINIASVGGQRGGPRAPHYSASKAGIISLTKSLSNIYASRGVRVNAISPGQIETGMSKGIFKTDYYKKNILPKIPLGRVGTTKDVANVALFLSSYLSSYITGQTINVNGGEYLE